jgi:thioredoxin-related protein
MKNVITLIIASAISLAASADPNYFKGSWEETLKKAKAENKYIMLDCYTDWCYWCKVMDKNTFPDDKVSKELNANFISAKREMEKDPEGVVLAMKYHVNAFPTFLFFSPEGQLVYISAGYSPASEFLNVLEAVRKPENQQAFPGLSLDLNPGFPDFYKNSFGPGKSRKYPEENTVTAFLDNTKDLFSEVAWSVMWRFTLNEKYNNWIMDNAPRLRTLYGKDQVDDKIVGILSKKVKTAAENKDDNAFKATIKTLYTQLPGVAAVYEVGFTFEYFTATAQWNQLTKFTQSVIDTGGYAKQAGLINEISWTMYESCSDKAELTKAAGWMKDVTKVEPNYMYLDTYASLLYATDQFAEAEKVALQAIDEGKKTKENVAATEDLLQNIRSKMKK